MKQSLLYIGLVIVFIALGIGSKTVYVMYQNGDFEQKEVIEESVKKEVDYTISSDNVYDSLASLIQVDLSKKLANQDSSEAIDSARQQDKISEKTKATEKVIKEVKSNNPEVERNGSLYKTPFYIISISAVSKKESAIKGALKIQKSKDLGNFLWIPDYNPNGKPLYKVYIGPFVSKTEAQKQKETLNSKYPGCYVQSIK
jgi:cell division septation protein DedD